MCSLNLTFGTIQVDITGTKNEDIKSAQLRHSIILCVKVTFETIITTPCEIRLDNESWVTGRFTVSLFNRRFRMCRIINDEAVIDVIPTNFIRISKPVYWGIVTSIVNI